MTEKIAELEQGHIDERELHKIKEAVCMQVEKVYDSCREKDCIENLEVFCIPKNLLDQAIDVVCRDVDVDDVIIDVEPLRFKKGFYTVTATFVFKVEVDLFFKNGSPQRECGVAIFTKKAPLFGSQGKVKIFKSKFKKGAVDTQYTPFLEQDNKPNGKVEVAEPICLSAELAECPPTNLSGRDVQIIKSAITNIQQNVANVNIREQGPGDVNVDIDQENVFNIGGGAQEPRVLVTIGLFTILKLVRLVQVLVPSFGFCKPPRCVAATAEEPCEFFDTIDFPRDAFFPPQEKEFVEEAEEDFDCHTCNR